VAKRAPWSAVSRVAEAGVPGLTREFLLWAGGIADRPTNFSGFAGFTLGNTRKPEWATQSGRPDNRPERRIAAAAAFADRWQAMGGPKAALSGLVKGIDRATDLIAALSARSEEPGARALVGQGRAAEISVNAVLPTLHACGTRTGDWDLMERSHTLFRDHPKLPENAITREMRRLLGSQPGGIDSTGEKLDGRRPGAREQQGLIYMYRSMTRAQSV
jgi:hypothetical protein